MSFNKISSATTTDMLNAVADYSVDSAEQDTAGTNYICDWSKWFGYYKAIPELQSVIDKKSIWTVGKGFKTDEETKKNLNKITGCGIDSFNSIMYNAVKTYTIGGDFFAEIIQTKRADLEISSQ